MPDFSKILERVPVWRQLTSSVARGEFVEPMFADPGSFGKPASNDHRPEASEDYPCDRCFSHMELMGVEKLDDLNVFGQVIHSLECPSCGLITRKIYTADEGYL